MFFDTFFGDGDVSGPAPGPRKNKASLKRGASDHSHYSGGTRGSKDPKLKRLGLALTNNGRAKKKESKGQKKSKETKLASPREWFDLEKVKEASSPVPALAHPPECIRLGSDFTGYGTDALALHFLGLNFKVAFSTEKDQHKQALMRGVEDNILGFAAGTKYADITKRDASSAPACDLFITGPPCGSWSSAGKGKGAKDSRGQLIFHTLQYIVSKQPRVVVLENVAGLMFRRHRAVFQQLLKLLKAMHYETHYRILNTRLSGIPQNRPRCYVVAIQSPKHQFKWPKDLPCVPLKRFLDSYSSQGDHPLTGAGLKTLKKLIKKHGREIEQKWYVFDAGASWKFTSCLKGCVPCLTRSRWRGHYIPKLRRFLNLREHGALQGLPSSVVNVLNAAVGGRDRILRAALGDAMSLNILMRVLGKALFSAGFVAAVPWDPWKQMAIDEHHCNSTDRCLPDVYVHEERAILKT